MTMRDSKDNRLIDLAIYRSVHRKAKSYKLWAFIFNRNPTVHPLSNSQVHCAEKILNLTFKRASTTAYKVYTPRNIMLRTLYWENDYSLGIANVQTNNMVDLNEISLYLENSNHRHGKMVRGFRTDDKGIYNRDQKMNVLARICGYCNNPIRWMKTWTDKGATSDRFVSFMRRFCTELVQCYQENYFCITMNS